jgi:hypothetical protein
MTTKDAGSTENAGAVFCPPWLAKMLKYKKYVLGLG